MWRVYAYRVRPRATGMMLYMLRFNRISCTISCFDILVVRVVFQANPYSSKTVLGT